MMQKYMCPVCGYSGLDEPPYHPITGDPSFNICPCCGCEYGYDDATPVAKKNFLRAWLVRGSPWFRPELKPIEWDIRAQLKVIGIDFDALGKFPD